MKMLIGKPTDSLKSKGWVPFDTDFLTPEEIRTRVKNLPLDTKIITMNSTVIELVPGLITVDDTYILKDGEVVPVLSFRESSLLGYHNLDTNFPQHVSLWELWPILMDSDADA